MMTVKQVSSLTGVSVRALQFYDEIGLFKPSEVTDAGYRLYDDRALEVLQQILFFKELDFTLKEIKAIMESPGFDKTETFIKQRELIQVKRDRLTSLLGLLDKLIKGETCMDFSNFEMERYFTVLEEFKKTEPEKIGKQMGGMERFDEMLLDLKSRGDEIAAMAVKQFGSIENFTKAMEKNLQAFLSDGPPIAPEEVDGLVEKTEEITRRLTADLSKDTSSAEIMAITGELISFTEECNQGVDMGENYWQFMADTYVSSPAFTEVTDKKYGTGASAFISRALKDYLKERQ